MSMAKLRPKQGPMAVKTPGPNGDKPGWVKVGIFAVVGLVIGVAWPSLAGIRIGPDVPGAKKTPPAASQVAPVATSAAASPALAKPAVAPDSGPKPTTTQLVVVGGGRITGCHRGRKRIKHTKECGTLKIDRVLAPRLKQLAGCPSALGLAGELELGFDIHFAKKEISVIKGDRGHMPASTVNGILACAADYIRDVNPDKISHKLTRYRVFYDLKFYPPGTAPPRSGADDVASEETSDERGLAAVTWDTALIRDEPRTGKVIARLVRGTRVKILSRRKDWYRVKIRSKEGWVYRGALGL
jgi:hypothetical protein